MINFLLPVVITTACLPLAYWIASKITVNMQALNDPFTCVEYWVAPMLIWVGLMLGACGLYQLILKLSERRRKVCK